MISNLSKWNQSNFIAIVSCDSVCVYEFEFFFHVSEAQKMTSSPESGISVDEQLERKLEDLSILEIDTLLSLW